MLLVAMQYMDNIAGAVGNVPCECVVYKTLDWQHECLKPTPRHLRACR